MGGKGWGEFWCYCARIRLCCAKLWTHFKGPSLSSHSKKPSPTGDGSHLVH
jgi:hypothetical protein